MKSSPNDTVTGAGENNVNDDASGSEAAESDDDRDSSETTRNSKRAVNDSQHTLVAKPRRSRLFRRSHRPPHPAMGPSPGFRKYPNRKLRETVEHPERQMSDNELAQFWYDKSERQRYQLKQLNAEISKWEDAHNAQLDRAEEEAAKYNREKEKLEKLMASHVRAVNSVGSGLEPVTDQSFAEKFEKLHHEVGTCSLRHVVETVLMFAPQVSQWCRSGFQEGGHAPQPAANTETWAQNLFQTRACDIKLLRLPELIDSMVWAFVEMFIFSLWMPGIGYDEFMFFLQSCIQRGGTLSLPLRYPSADRLRFHFRW